MLVLQVTQSIIIENLVGLIGGMADEIILYCSSTGISLQARDTIFTENYLTLYLKSDFFDFYFCDRDISFSFRFLAISQMLMLDLVNVGDTITISRVDSGIVNYTIERPDRENISAETTLPENSNVRLPIQEGPYEVNVELPSREFTILYNTLITPYHPETAKISLTTGRITFSMDWLVDYVSFDLPKSIVTVNTNLTDPVSFTFGFKRTPYILRASAMSDYILISMSSGLPVVLEFTIEQMGCFRLYLS